MKIFFSESAMNDLQNILDYYNQENVKEIGNNFVLSIFEHVEILTNHPDIGRIVPEFNLSYIREIIHIPFRIVYLREKSSIKIIRVWRCERLLKLP